MDNSPLAQTIHFTAKHQLPNPLVFLADYFEVAFLTYRSSLFKSSCASSPSVFCFIESGSHSDKTESQTNRLK